MAQVFVPTGEGESWAAVDYQPSATEKKIEDAIRQIWPMGRREIDFGEPDPEAGLLYTPTNFGYSSGILKDYQTIRWDGSYERRTRIQPGIPIEEALLQLSDDEKAYQLFFLTGRELPPPNHNWGSFFIVTTAPGMITVDVDDWGYEPTASVLANLKGRFRGRLMTCEGKNDQFFSTVPFEDMIQTIVQIIGERWTENE